jgi:hypothetical protein
MAHGGVVAAIPAARRKTWRHQTQVNIFLRLERANALMCPIHKEAASVAVLAGNSRLSIDSIHVWAIRHTAYCHMTNLPAW